MEELLVAGEAIVVELLVAAVMMVATTRMGKAMVMSWGKLSTVVSVVVLLT